ncbi:hypothetical protein HYX11_03740 [Candidatus Woesearchaeota archaeon]|nr:hypothetical protein [Candidatus Woesearchaeota archaeon]
MRQMTEDVNAVSSLKVTKRGAIFLMLLCTLFTSTGQIFWKLGVKNASFSNLLSFVNVLFIAGCLFYGVGAILMLIAFKSGELSVLYPIIATSYVWVSLASPLIFLTDKMNVLKWIGVIIILISICILGYGSSKKGEEN